MCNVNSILLLLLISTVCAFECESCFYKHIKYENYGGVDLCENNYFYITYSKDKKNPDYSAYYLTVEHMKKLQGGRRSFILDPILINKSIEQANPSSKAFSTTINRGHLTPSYAMSWDKGDNGPWYHTYMMSNIAPQNYKLNQNDWASLEKKIVNFVLHKETDLYVVTGVGYNNRKNITMLADNIAYPDYFFTVICDEKNYQSAGFIGMNNDIFRNETNIFRTVGSVENKIDIKLFKDCNNDNVNIQHWWSQF